MKKYVSLLLALVMVVSLFAGCGNSKDNGSSEVKEESTTQAQAETSANEENGQSEASTPTEVYTIAVAWNAIDDTTQMRMDYLQKELGPALGLEFIFSEEITDADQMMTFIENSYAAGADAVLSTVTDAVEQVAAKCEELGLYLATQTSRYSEDIADLNYNMGICGVNLTKVGLAYAELLNDTLDANNKLNIIIVSGGAAMGVTSHMEATATMLKQVSSIYGINYTEDVMALTTSAATTDVASDSDVKITIVPGFPGMEGYVAGMSSLLQTGEYDVMLSVYPANSTFATVIDEVEKALNKNIIVLSNASFGEGTKLAFETLDSTGDSTLNGAVLYALTAQDAYGIVMLYNGLTGHSDLIKPDGKAAILATGALVASNLEEYQKLSLLDTSSDTYCYNAEEVKSMTAVFNPEQTNDGIHAFINQFSADELIIRRGLDK